MLIACQKVVSEPANDNATYSSSEVSSTPSISSASVQFEDEGMRFSYPQNYSIAKTQGAHSIGIFLKSKQTVSTKSEDPEPPPSDFEDITIYVKENPDNLSLQQIAEKDSGIDFALKTVAGEQAASYLFPSLYSTEIVAVIHNGKVYTFETYENSGAQDDVSRILRSLEFTD